MPHVLIVDDSPTNVMQLKSLLKKAGYQTSEAHTAEEGVTKARELRPDLVLMDVVLPGMSGFQATRKINRDPVTASIPVIIVSVKNLESDKAWGLRQGAREYLTQPIADADLLAVIQRHIGSGK
jgi:twitching motility two-component system response regulator PilH